MNAFLIWLIWINKTNIENFFSESEEERIIKRYWRQTWEKIVAKGQEVKNELTSSSKNILSFITWTWRFITWIWRSKTTWTWSLVWTLLIERSQILLYWWWDKYKDNFDTIDWLELAWELIGFRLMWAVRTLIYFSFYSILAHSENKWNEWPNQWIT